MRRFSCSVVVLTLLAACSDDGAGGLDTDGADSNASSPTSGETSAPDSDGPTGPDSSGGPTGPDPEDTDDPGDDTDDPDTGVEPACEAVGFGDANVWTLPDVSALPLVEGDAIEVMANNWACTNDEDFRFTMLDLTGDGRSDFVITDGCDAEGVGVDRWIVHPAEDGGFGNATTWTLPDVSALPLVEGDVMEVVANNWPCTNDEDFRYITTDLTGDGRVDFVITDGCDATGVGVDRWIVHPGQDGGFGDAVTWTLPDFGALPLVEGDVAQIISDNWPCTNDEDFRFTTTDLTGDGVPDFVITDGCDATGVGVERWIVHPGGEGGFGAATTWSLPDVSALPLVEGDVMQIFSDNWPCTNDEDFRFTTTDLTGDGVVDLVITDGCDATGVGVERWIVHPGGDSGFGEATTWTLPDVSALPLVEGDVMQILADFWPCTNDEDFRFITTDLTGDGTPDFVITDGCDATGVGLERWIQHPGVCE